MGRKRLYKDFVSRYLARGAVGVSVGLAGIAPVSTAAPSETSRSEQIATRSFSDRLATVRSAVSVHLNEPLYVAQVVHPPPPPPPFKNFFGKAPFQDAFRNVPLPPPKASTQSDQAGAAEGAVHAPKAKVAAKKRAGKKSLGKKGAAKKASGSKGQEQKVTPR